MVSRIEPKLGGSHRDEMEIQNCIKAFVTISKTAATAAILCPGLLSVVRLSLFFTFSTSSPELCRIKLKLVGGIGATWRFKIAKIVAFRYSK